MLGAFVFVIIVAFCLPFVLTEIKRNSKKNSPHRFNYHKNEETARVRFHREQLIKSIEARKQAAVNGVYKQKEQLSTSTDLHKVEINKTLGPPREPLPHSIRKQIYLRANQQCENPFCRSNGRLDIHHIDMNHNNNRLYNLIALCQTCHADAHSGKYPPTQVHNWMNMDYQRMLHRQN